MRRVTLTELEEILEDAGYKDPDHAAYRFLHTLSLNGMLVANEEPPSIAEVLVVAGFVALAVVGAIAFVASGGRLV